MPLLIIRVNVIENVGADALAEREAGDLGPRRIEIEPGAFPIGLKDHFTQVFHHMPVFFLALQNHITKTK